MPIQVFGAGAVQTAYVSYEAIDLTSNSVTLIWPNTYINLPSEVNGIYYNVLAASMNVNTLADNTYTVTLPDATQSTVGYNFIITNIGVSSFTLLKSDSSELIVIPATENANSYWVQLMDNSTSAGTWTFLQFGAGTSSAVASALAGNGLVALGGLLNTNTSVSSIAANYTVVATDRAKLLVWTGGTGTITLPAIATVPAGFFVSVNISSSAEITLSGNGANIDGEASINLFQYYSLTVISDGTQWWTLGLGQNALSNNFANGSASDPSITFLADETTGIYYSPGLPYLGFSVSGNQVGQFTYDTENSKSYFTVVNGTNTIGLSATVTESTIYSDNNNIIISPKGTNNAVELYNGTNAVQLHFYDATGTYYSGLKASNSLTQSTVWTLPLTDGTTGQFLNTNGSGVLSFVSGNTGTVTSITAGTGLSGGTITSTGTIALNVPVLIASGGTGASTQQEAINALMPAAVIGNLIYYDGTNWVVLAPGTTGQVLTMAGGVPTWA